MRRISVVLAVAAVALLVGVGPAAQAQTATTLPGIPAGQGGPDNNINPTQQGGAAPGGRDNPAVDAGPATATDDGSLTPWLIGAGVLVLLAAGAAAVVVTRRSNSTREPSYS